MNIGIFSDTYYPQLNGVATSIRTLAKGLEAKGHNVYIFTPKDPLASETMVEHNVFRIPSLPVFFIKHYRAGVPISPFLTRKINYLDLDIIHTQTEFMMGFFGKYISTTHGIPMVHTYHTKYEDYVHYIARGHIISKDMARDFSRAFCNTATDVITPTEKTAELLKEYGVNTPISVIPTGIDTAKFNKDSFPREEVLALRRSLGLREDTPVILTVGRIGKEKSMDTIIHAMPRLVKKLPDVMLVIIGEGPEAENLQLLADVLGVKKNVLFTGGKPWTEMGKYYQLGDVFCSASTSETQGLTFAEAMSAGIPVVAKKDPCIELIVDHNKTGLLFEDDNALADVLYSVLTDADLAKRLSDEGVERMKTLSAEKFCDTVEALYKKILSDGDAPQRIAPPAIPLVVGVTAARKMVYIPKKIVKGSLRLSKEMFHALSGVEKDK